MEESEKDYKISIELELGAVAWAAVLRILCDNFKLSYEQASRLIRNFHKHFRSVLSLRWLVFSELSVDEGRLLAAICEVHGADAVRIWLSRGLLGSHSRIKLRQQIDFFPAFRTNQQAAKGGYLLARYVISFFGRELVICKVWQALLVHVLFVLFAIVSYVLLVGCLLYGLSVLLLFIMEPAFVTLAATNRAPLGLALLCMLVGLAGIFGKAVHNLLIVAKGGLRRKN